MKGVGLLLAAAAVAALGSAGSRSDGEERRGATIRVTLRGPDGAPTSGRIALHRQDRPSPFDGHSSPVGDDGLRELHVVWPGTYLLHGTAELGSGVLGPLELDPREGDQDFDLVVRGPGEIRGLLVDKEGRPVPRLELTASVPSLEGLPFQRRRELVSLIGREGRGNAVVSVSTDDSGRFRFRGLRDDDYSIQAGSTHLVHGTVRPNGPDLRLEYTQPHLVVRVQHPDGTAPDVVVGDGGGWPEDVRVSVYEPRHTGRARRRLRGTEIGAGTLRFEPGEGGDCLVEVCAPGQAPFYDSVHVPADGLPAEHRLLLDRPRGRGELELSVFSDAAPLASGLRLRIREQGGPSWVVDTHVRRAEEGWPMRLELPEGSYVLAVESEGSAPFGCGRFALHHRGVLGGCSAEFSITAGGKTPLPVDLLAPGRIELFVTAGEGLQGESSRITATVEDEDDFVSRLSFRDGKEKWLELGGTGISAPLPPGTYTLHVRADEEGPVLSEEVTVHSGQNTSVTFEF